MKIYWAGPLFTAAERQWNAEITDYLQEFGHQVWLPQEKEPREKTAHSIFQMDREGIDWAEVVIAVMDGPDPDSGTCWECGYAYAKGKPIITVRTDFRGIGDDREATFNLMLWASASINIHFPLPTTIDLVIMIEKALKEVAHGAITPRLA